MKIQLTCQIPIGGSECGSHQVGHRCDKCEKAICISHQISHCRRGQQIGFFADFCAKCMFDFSEIHLRPALRAFLHDGSKLEELGIIDGGTQ